MYKRAYTPERITSMAKNEIFVFGSNLAGAHGGGAARLAYEQFGAVWGVFPKEFVEYLASDSKLFL